MGSITSFCEGSVLIAAILNEVPKQDHTFKSGSIPPVTNNMFPPDIFFKPLKPKYYIDIITYQSLIINLANFEE